jgi:restriction system protein
MDYGGAEQKNFEVVGKSGDNGIDGIIYQDKLGIDRIYVQAKKWTDNKVHSKDIRDFIGSLRLKGTNKGVFITTSQFTDDAVRTANANPANIIVLIDGKKLTDLAIEYNAGVQVKEHYQVKTVDWIGLRSCDSHLHRITVMQETYLLPGYKKRFTSLGRL